MPAAAFAHVLDRLIDDGAGPSSTAVTAGILTSPLLAAPFTAGRPSMVFRSMPLVSSPRPIRALSAAQVEALGVLRRAGAHDLPANYFASELKSAFRRLARQLHPDRHPSADAAARAALGAAFREVRDAYRALPL